MDSVEFQARKLQLMDWLEHLNDKVVLQQCIDLWTQLAPDYDWWEDLPKGIQDRLTDAVNRIDSDLSKSSGFELNDPASSYGNADQQAPSDWDPVLETNRDGMLNWMENIEKAEEIAPFEQLRTESGVEEDWWEVLAYGVKRSIALGQQQIKEGKVFSHSEAMARIDQLFGPRK